MGGEDPAKARIAAECGVSDLDAPAVGIVERGAGTTDPPRRYGPRPPAPRRQDPVRISASAEGLIDWHNVALRVRRRLWPCSLASGMMP